MTFPDALDGALGVKFVDSAVESSASGGTWTSCELLI